MYVENNTNKSREQVLKRMKCMFYGEFLVEPQRMYAYCDVFYCCKFYRSFDVSSLKVVK